MIIERNGRYFELTAADAHLAIRIRRRTQVRVLFDLLVWVQQIVETGAAAGSLTCTTLVWADCTEIKSIR